MFGWVMGCLCGAVGCTMGSVTSCMMRAFVGCMGFCGFCSGWMMRTFCGSSMGFGWLGCMGSFCWTRFLGWFWRMVCCGFNEGGFN